jgi:hypothetical protein
VNHAVNASIDDSAAQVRWILHLACAATFMVVMTLLANRLPWPIRRTLSVVWGWQTILTINLCCYFSRRELFVEHASVRVVGTRPLSWHSNTNGPSRFASVPNRTR